MSISTPAGQSFSSHVALSVGLQTTAYAFRPEPGQRSGDYPSVDPLRSHTSMALPLVSLGCSCGPKLALRELGRNTKTLPFDWMCTTVEGVIEFLSSDFQGFFAFNNQETEKLEGADMPITVFRAAHHSWWHDDPTDPATQEKYRRRIQRLNTMRAVNEPILFIRLVATTNELQLLGSLLRKLIEKFGPSALLLVIVGGQSAENSVPYAVEGMPNLLVHFIEFGSGEALYCPPIQAAIDWAAGTRLPGLGHLQDLRAVQSLARPYHAGLFGMGGIPAFDDLPASIPRPKRFNSSAGNAAAGAPVVASSIAPAPAATGAVAVGTDALSRSVAAVPSESYGAALGGSLRTLPIRTYSTSLRAPASTVPLGTYGANVNAYDILGASRGHQLKQGHSGGNLWDSVQRQGSGKRLVGRQAAFVSSGFVHAPMNGAMPTPVQQFREVPTSVCPTGNLPPGSPAKSAIPTPVQQLGAVPAPVLPTRSLQPGSTANGAVPTPVQQLNAVPAPVLLRRSLQPSSSANGAMLTPVQQLGAVPAPVLPTRSLQPGAPANGAGPTPVQQLGAVPAPVLPTRSLQPGSQANGAVPIPVQQLSTVPAPALPTRGLQPGSRANGAVPTLVQQLGAVPATVLPTRSLQPGLSPVVTLSGDNFNDTPAGNVLQNLLISSGYSSAAPSGNLSAQQAIPTLLGNNGFLQQTDLSAGGSSKSPPAPALPADEEDEELPPLRFIGSLGALPALPPPAPPQGDRSGLEVGGLMQVWSKGSSTWCPGTIEKLEGKMVWVHYRSAQGHLMSKGIPIGHPDLQPPDNRHSLMPRHRLSSCPRAPSVG